MTALDYTRARATVERLLARFGQAGSIRRTTTSGGDAWNPGSGTATTTNHACTVVVFDYKDMEVDGTRIIAGDKRVLISTSGLTIVPKERDKITIGGVDHAIISIETLAPGGVNVLYTAQVRR